jgi:Zn-dependent protease with chaperone function
MADAMYTHTHPGYKTNAPARDAAARVSRAGLLLGALGLLASLFVIVRLFGAWHVASRAGSHQISILGVTLAYPSANAEAIVILALAAVGLAVIGLAVLAAAQELAGAIRLGRRLKAARPVQSNGALVIADEVPRAFCAGFFRPRTYISSAALSLLDEPALDAVLAHERHHAERRDPLRLATMRVIARALFFLPTMAELARRQVSLTELGADENAVIAASGDRSALARAMLSFAVPGNGGDGVGVDPTRVDYLLGEPQNWRFPALLCLAAASVLTLIAAVAALAGKVAAGSATLTLPLVSRQPCIVVLAMIPTALALLGGYFAVVHRARTK